MMSAGMGERFSQVAAQMTDRIRKLGPNPIHRKEEKPNTAAKAS